MQPCPLRSVDADPCSGGPSARPSSPNPSILFSYHKMLPAPSERAQVQPVTKSPTAPARPGEVGHKVSLTTEPQLFPEGVFLDSLSVIAFD